MVETAEDFGEEYLRVCGAASKLIPGSLKGTDRWIKPIFLYGIMGALNDALSDQYEQVHWTVQGNQVKQSPVWTVGGLRQRIISRRQFIGTNPQLDTVLRKFVTVGFLDRHKENVWISSAGLKWLLTHARSFFEAITGREAPTVWTAEKGAWLDYNRSLFQILYDDIGSAWRDGMRAEVNRKIAATRPPNPAKKTDRSYHNDPMGDHPEYWVVIMIAGFIPDISEFDIASRARALSLGDYVLSAHSITVAIEDLCRYQILMKEHGKVSIHPGLAEHMSAIRRSVNKHYPSLRELSDKIET